MESEPNNLTYKMSIEKFTYKVVILGDSSVGKSSIINRYINKVFSEYGEPTIGAAFFTSITNIDNKEIKLEIWDTAGQERYKSLAPMYYRGSNAALVVYDITDKQSFTSALKWIDELKMITVDCLIYLIGNKSDLEDKRKVNSNDIYEIINNNDFKHYETSAKNSKNIDLIFQEMSLNLSERFISQQNEENNREILINNNNKNSCCTIN
jgi:small GTP-binding protein